MLKIQVAKSFGYKYIVICLGHFVVWPLDCKMYNRSKNILSTVLGRKIQLSLPHFNCLVAINPIILFLEKEDFVLV